ncbi:patatin-like phospholipase family protein [Phaeodactylibacter luteus]|uniref:Patatin-like phospholipase family protein n=1 Tax=Phaeodactylibacter luteus TaxID=1564516 RepID=A0A5C6RG01_9BACT|nr:patatin-like phospholipase family protein [Phaeodactylibacter luteus]TXB60585.1 patatin-like phospholipase family protein [Phaeodactylibacter luteus]
MDSKEIKLGLALSGGGARGIAHVGVLQALEDNGLKPSVISGTSAGAIAGALYASGLSPVEILSFVKKASLFKVFKVGLPHAGLTRHTYLRAQLEKLIASDRFEDLNIPLYIAMANLNKGVGEVRHAGPLFDVVTASSAIPLVFQPVEIDGSLYVDGGLLDNLPAEAIRGACDVLLGVNVMPRTHVEKKAVQNVIGIAQRCFDLSIVANTQHSLDACDVVVEPEELLQYTIMNLNRYQEIYEIGYKAMQAKMGALRKAIRRAKAEHSSVS